MEEVNFLPYLPPNSKSNRVAEGGKPGESSKGETVKVDPLWLEALEMIDGDLHWLLQQTHHKFWCQVREESEGGREGEIEGGHRERQRLRGREGGRERERERGGGGGGRE